MLNFHSQIILFGLFFSKTLLEFFSDFSSTPNNLNCKNYFVRIPSNSYYKKKISLEGEIEISVKSLWVDLQLFMIFVKIN